MVKRSEDMAELVHAATVIERDLRRFEELARSIANIGLHSQKSIARAGSTLQQALQQQEQLASDLRLLGEAMLGTQQRQQRAIEAVAARALEIQHAATVLAAHTGRFVELGERAADVTRSLKALPSPYGEAPGSQGSLSVAAGGVPAELESVERELLALAEEAKALADSAEDAALTELAREASSLHQSLQTAHRRLAAVTHRRPQQLN